MQQKYVCELVHLESLYVSVEKKELDILHYRKRLHFCNGESFIFIIGYTSTVMKLLHLIRLLNFFNDFLIIKGFQSLLCFTVLCP